MMFGALLKKQLLENSVWLIQNKKKGGARRSVGGILAYILLYLFVFASLGTLFFGMGMFICEPLCAAGYGWLYFAMMGLVAIFFGVFGSVFTTFTGLYLSKDNELLLSMPIPPMYILTSKLLGVWLWSFLYSALVFLPALLVYWLTVPTGLAAILCGFLLLLLISVFVVALSCMLGWVVAKISVKLKNKSLVTVLLSLLFLAVYYVVYFRANQILQTFLTNAAAVGGTMRGIFPLYWIGLAGTGSWLYLLLAALLIIALMAAIIAVMSHSFIQMTTAGTAAKKKVYVAEKAKRNSVFAALLCKEFRRLTASAGYMLNCALGTLLLPALGIFALVKADSLQAVVTELNISPDMLALLLCAAMCMAASMNDLTAPSISLEGKTLWLLQSLPVPAWQVLKAKLSLHILVTEIPVVFCVICLSIAAKLPVVSTLLLLLLSSLFVLLEAAFGLSINLKAPNLTWTNENVPIKQSSSVFFALFGGWLFVIALAALYFAVHSFLSATAYLVLCGGIVALLTVLLLLWLKKKGSNIFAAL